MKLLCLMVLSGCGVTATLPVRTAPVLDDAAAERDAWVMGVGAEFKGHTERFLAPDESFTERVELGPDCAVFSVVAAPGVRDVDVSLWLPNGTRLAADLEPDPAPTVQACGVRGDVFVRVHAYQGAGLVSLRRYSAPSARELGRPGSETYQVAQDGPPEELSGALRRRGFRLFAERELDAEEPSLEVVLPVSSQAGCYALVARSAEEVRLSGMGPDATSRARGTLAAVQWCSTAPGENTASVAAEGHVRIWMYRAEEGDVGGTAGLWLGDRSAPER